MLVGLIGHPLIDFIHYAKDIPFLAETSNILQFFLSKNFAQRIIGSVDNDGFGFLAKFRSQLLLYQNPIRGMVAFFFTFLIGNMTMNL